MTEAGRGPRWHTLLLVLAGLPLFFWQLDAYSVVNGDEAFYHRVAQRMVQTGNWFRLDFPGVDTTYDTFMNSPTHYWARAALIAVLGDNLWTMRLLSATFGLLTVLCVHRLALVVAPDARDGAALVAALVQLTTFQFIYLHGARTGELDTIVCFLMTAAALTFLRAVRERGSFVPHHACLALMLTVKLPVVIMPVAAELALFASTSAFRPHFRRYVLSALAIVPLGLLWHVGQALWRLDDLADVVATMSGEAAGTVGARAGTIADNVAWHAENALFGAYPWSLAMVPALGAALFARRRTEDERSGWRVVTFFALVVWVFFAFVSKRFPWYVLPTFPFLAVCTGGWIGRLARSRSAPRWTAVAAAAGIGALLLWRRVPLLDARPLTRRAPLVPMDLGWQRFPGLDREVGVLLAFVVLLALSWWLRRSTRERFGPWLAGLLVAVLLPLAAVRVALPLRALEFRSPLDTFYQQVEARRVSGPELRFPIVIPVPHHDLTARYYFGRRYIVRRVRGIEGVPKWALNGIKQPLAAQEQVQAGNAVRE